MWNLLAFSFKRFLNILWALQNTLVDCFLPVGRNMCVFCFPLWVVGYLSCFCFWTIKNNDMNICVQALMWTYSFISLGSIPKSGLAGSYGDSMFRLLRNWQTLPTIYESSSFSLSSSTLCVVWMFDYSHSSRCEEVSHYGLNMHVINDVESLFMCSLAICISSLHKCVFTSFVWNLFLIRLLKLCNNFYNAKVVIQFLGVHNPIDSCLWVWRSHRRHAI